MSHLHLEPDSPSILLNVKQTGQDERKAGDNHRQFVVHVDEHQPDLPLLSEAPSTTSSQMRWRTQKSQTAKTPAERLRAYRERNKALKNATKRLKFTTTSAERVRAWRVRKKALENAAKQELMIDSHGDDVVELEVSTKVSHEGLNARTSTAFGQQCGERTCDYVIEPPSNSGSSNIVKPTRRIFYEKFINGVQMHRNWITSYRKAKDGICNGVVSNNDMVSKISPCFDDLDKVFGNKKTLNAEIIINNEYDFDSSSDLIIPEIVLKTAEPTIDFKPSMSEFNFSEESLFEPSSSTMFKVYEQCSSEEFSPESNTEFATSKEDKLSEVPLLEPSSSTQPTVVRQKYPDQYPKRGVKRIFPQMLRVQSSLIEVLKQQCELQTRKMEQELQLRKTLIDLMQNQFNFEKEKHFKDLQIKEKHIESTEKIILHEIDLEREKIRKDFEIKEKIALNELQIKERLAMKKFESKRII